MKSPVLRKYWREAKRKYRAKLKAAALKKAQEK